MRALSGGWSIGLYLAAFTMVVGPGHAAAETPVPPVVVRVLNQPNVSVANTVKNPVPVGDAQNPAFNPFQVDARFSLGRGEGSAEAVLPGVGNDGQRVVIEHVTVDASIPAGQRTIAYIKIGEIKHALVLTDQGPGARPTATGPVSRSGCTRSGAELASPWPESSGAPPQAREASTSPCRATWWISRSTERACVRGV